MRKRWKARIVYDNKEYYLGTFDTKQEAALAYDRKARQCGQDKLLNYASITAAEDAAAQAQAEQILVHDMCAGPKQPKPRPPSGYYGVHAAGKQWQAHICYDSEEHYLGTFDTKQEAALTYDRKARQRGQDKLLNYESIKAAEEAAVEAEAGTSNLFGLPRRQWFDRGGSYISMEQVLGKKMAEGERSNVPKAADAHTVLKYTD
jgi:hypothetical protein